MAVRKAGFVGFRSSDLAALRQVFEEGLELEPTAVADDQVRYALADGTRLEGYSESNAFHAFFTTGPVVGFAVDDFERSWRRLAELGIEALTEVQEEHGVRWVHFRLPDGTVAELIGPC